MDEIDCSMGGYSDKEDPRSLFEGV